MKITKLLLRLLPGSIKQSARVRREKHELGTLKTVHCEGANLRPESGVSLSETMNSVKVGNEWREVKKKLDTFALPDGTGGVNPGDRRAIYHLIRELQPTTVLEIGTHIGASTLHIAAALFQNWKANEIAASLITVDVQDVNDPHCKSWLRYGSPCAPKEMIERMGYQSLLQFVTDASLNYLSTCRERYDFIFLDGDHAAKAVYQEIPAALNVLNRNGVILLHDYFPNLMPLWSDGSVLPGPYLATERLIREGARVHIVPLGKLPWPTKLDSNVSSLAVLVKND